MISIYEMIVAEAGCGAYHVTDIGCDMSANLFDNHDFGWRDLPGFCMRAWISSTVKLTMMGKYY